MRSGQLAHLTGVSTDSLRHYERLGLLPLPQRTAGNYREYAPTFQDGSFSHVPSLQRRRALRRVFCHPKMAVAERSELEVFWQRCSNSTKQDRRFATNTTYF